MRKGTELKFSDGPQAFSRHYVEPKDGITQTFHLHLEEYGPGGKSQKHGHVNEAASILTRWKGKLGIEATDDDWFSVQVRQRGEANGLRLFRDLVKTSGLSVRKGHTLLTQMVASGEVDYALTVYNFTAEQLRQRGAPIAWHALPPVVARSNGVAVPLRAAHPHAALLYYDFMLGDEAQKILGERDFVPASRNVPSPLANVPLVVVDPAQLLDDGDKWSRLYDEIVVKQST